MLAIASKLFLLQYMLYELDIAEFMIVFFTSFDILEILQACAKFLISDINPNVEIYRVNMTVLIEQIERSAFAQCLRIYLLCSF